MKDIQAINPEKWPSNNDARSLEAESRITKICKMFHILSKDIIIPFKKFFSFPRCVPIDFNERMTQGLLNIIPISSFEAERRFSKMNWVCINIRSPFMVKHLSSLMFMQLLVRETNLYAKQEIKKLGRNERQRPHSREPSCGEKCQCQR